jgi:hypothetical protein
MLWYNFHHLCVLRLVISKGNNLQNICFVHLVGRIQCILQKDGKRQPIDNIFVKNVVFMLKKLSHKTKKMLNKSE